MSTAADPGVDIRLAPWEKEDVALLIRMNEPAMTEHLGGPESEEQLWNRHQRYLNAGVAETTYIYKVVLGPEATPVGNVNFWDREWRGEPVYEIGWGILPEYQGKGLATRAVLLAIEKARETGRRRFLHAFPSIDNAPSNAICRKAGFALIEAVDFEYPKGHFMRCNDWRFDLTA